MVYHVETKRLNEQVKRNLKRFPGTFMFQLTQEEWDTLQLHLSNMISSESLQSQFATAKRRSLPYAFTEQGVSMLSAVLNSDTAIEVSIQIMQAFVAMRKTLGNLHGVIQRLEGVELRQLQTDSKLEQIFQALEKDTKPTQGIFFEGQLFDAHVFASDLVKKAKKSIELLDNYLDETTLLLLSKRRKGVSCIVHTRIKPVLQKDLEKHNKQYEPITLIENRGSHDRFLILDDQELYHIGASLKDLGNKCFTFSRMDNFLEVVKGKLLNC
nr:ORF6N domain-containing protein [Cecembia calidifontis]